MKSGQRPKLELDRRRLEAVKKQVDEAASAWVKLVDLVSLAVNKTLLEDQVDPKAYAYYLDYRDEWLTRWHGFVQAIESLYTDSEQVPSGGLNAIERCFYYPSLGSTIDGIRKYGGDDKVETATFIPAGDFWVRVAGRVRDLEASLPSRRQERVGWIRSRPDWIEAHPRTVVVFVALAAAIVVSVGFISARDLADLIRAIEGR